MITQEAAVNEKSGGLVLSRKAGEMIRIGDDIEIQVVRIKGNCVRLRIVARKDVTILRGEIEPHEQQDERTSGM